jgi:hypothetical protein
MICRLSRVLDAELVVPLLEENSNKQVQKQQGQILSLEVMVSMLEVVMSLSVLEVAVSVLEVVVLVLEVEVAVSVLEVVVLVLEVAMSVSEVATEVTVLDLPCQWL